MKVSARDFGIKFQRLIADLVPYLRTKRIWISFAVAFVLLCAAIVVAALPKDRGDFLLYGKNIEVISYEDGVESKLFPTAELDAIRPRGPVHLSWSTQLKTPGNSRVKWKIDFDRWKQTVEVTYSKIGQSAYHEKYSGTYEVKGNMLFLTLDDGLKIVIKNDENKYVFVEAVQKDGMIIRTDGEIVFTFKSTYPSARL